MQVINVDKIVLDKLRSKLQSGPEIVRYEDDPSLASLCSCLGLQFEIGRPGFDRFSPFLGFDVENDLSKQWICEIISDRGDIGLRLKLSDGSNLAPRHPDLAHILDASSFDAEGLLRQAIIFPRRVATYFKRTHDLQLVIVRDWILETALNPNAESIVPYLETNPWEIKSNIAFTQIKLMVNRQLAFFGTHDIVDHLFGAKGTNFSDYRAFYEGIFSEYQEIFSKSVSNSQLVVSYLIGVLLDDLAQPKWYGSANHMELVKNSIRFLKTFPTSNSSMHVPKSFHSLVNHLREHGSDLSHLHVLAAEFFNDASHQLIPIPPPTYGDDVLNSIGPRNLRIG